MIFAKLSKSHQNHAPRWALAFDTALSGCNVCVFDGLKKRAVIEQQEMQRGQAEALVPLIQKAVSDAGIAFKDIDVSGTTIGPGSFTGLRVGLSTARSFALALSIPLAGFTTFKIFADRFFQDNVDMNGKKLCVIIESKRQDFYAQFYDDEGAESGAPLLINVETLKNIDSFDTIIFTGDGVLRFQSDIGFEVNSFMPESKLSSPQIIAENALRLMIVGALDLENTPQPFYLREADVSAPKRKNNVIQD